MSRLHARIVQADQHFEVRGLGSKNGTFVNGARLGQAGHVLQTGDRIELARGQVVLRFRATGSTLTLQTADVSEEGDLSVDAGSRDVWVRGVKMEPPLSRKEFDVLHLLYQKRAGVLQG